MKVDTNLIMSLLKILWIVQIIIYLAQLIFPKRIPFGLNKTLNYSILSCVTLGIGIFVTGIYSTTPNATCGTERFNPITLLTFYGSVVSLFIFLIVYAFNKVGVILKSIV